MLQWNGWAKIYKSIVSVTDKVESRNIVKAGKLQLGLGMLHSAVHWQKGGTVADMIDGVKNFILKYLHFAYVYLIFDRYYN